MFILQAQKNRLSHPGLLSTYDKFLIMKGKADQVWPNPLGPSCRLQGGQVQGGGGLLGVLRRVRQDIHPFMDKQQKIR